MPLLLPLLASTKEAAAGLRSDLGEVVVVEVAGARVATISFSPSSVITFEFPETPSFSVKNGSGLKKTSSSITLVSWGDGGGGKGGGVVDVA